LIDTLTHTITFVNIATVAACGWLWIPGRRQFRRQLWRDRHVLQLSFSSTPTMKEQRNGRQTRRSARSRAAGRERSAAGGEIKPTVACSRPTHVRQSSWEPSLNPAMHAVSEFKVLMCRRFLWRRQ